jgi:hypothetical protein
MILTEAQLGTAFQSYIRRMAKVFPVSYQSRADGFAKLANVINNTDELDRSTS